MLLSVVQGAKPDHFKRLGVIRMMSVALAGSTNFARQTNKRAFLQSILNDCARIAL